MKPVVFEGFEASVKAFFSGRCQAYTTDASGLASIRNKEAPNPDDYVILPELISKEPLGPMVRRGDDEWFTIVKWAIYALLEAEEYGITQANVDQMKSSTGPADPAHPRHVRRHRQAAGPGQGLGVPRDQGGRQLRRDLRAQRRPELGAETAARPQQPVEQGRPPVRAADSLTRAGARGVRAKTPRLVLAQPGGARPDLPAGGGGGDRRRRLVPRAQHAGEHAGARHPERLRLPRRSRPASTSARASSRSTPPIRTGRRSWSASPTRCARRSSASCSPRSSAR